MSYRVAQNLGPRKVHNLYVALSKGYDLKQIAAMLHISESRASRIINALFDWKPVPRPWTEEFLRHASEAAEYESKEFLGYAEEMTKIIKLPAPKKRA